MDPLKVGILVEANSAGVGSGLRPGLLAVKDFDTQTGRALTSLQDRMKQTSTAISSTFSSLSTNQKLFAGFGVGIALVGTALAKSIGPAIQFESAFAGVRKTVDGTPAQLESIRQGILDMSAAMPTAADELASIAENAGQLGVAAPDILEFTQVIAELGETTDLSFDDAAQSLARFLNVTGSGASGISPVSDVIVQLGNNAATTESQIVDFASRLASAFTVAGATEDQILGVASAFSSMGVRAEAGGSALSKVITVIGDAAIDGGQDLEVLADTAGLTAEEFRRVAAEDPSRALVLFAEGLGDIRDEGGSLTGIFEDLELGGLRTSEVLRLAALNSELLIDQLDMSADAYENGGARAEEYAKRIETTASRIEIFQNRLNTVAITLGTPLLDGLAVSVDTAGDAILGLLDIVGPVGAQIGDLFGSIAVTIGSFIAALGSPALAAGIAGLEVGADVLATILGILNALDPRVVVIGALAADLAFVGPASIAAARGLQAVGLGASFAATGTLSLGAAMRFLPFFAAGAALIVATKVFGVELQTIGQKAREAAAAFEDDLGPSIEGVEFEKASKEMARLKERIEEIRAIDGVVDPGLFQGLQNVLNIVNSGVFGTDNVVELRRELEELEGVLEASNVDEYEVGLDRVAKRFGLTSEAADQMIREMGLIDGVVELGTLANEEYAHSFDTVIGTIGENIAAQEELADKTGIALQKILDGTAGLGDYSDALGLTSSQLQFMADKVDSVNLEDLFDEEKSGAAFDALDALVGVYADLADEIGLTTIEFVGQLQSVQNLAAAHSDLRSAIDGTKSALQLMNEQQNIVAAETKNFDEAVSELAAGDGSLIDAAGAMRNLSLEYAGSGVNTNDAIQKQKELRAALIDAGVAAGGERAEVTRLVDELGLVPEAVLSEITLEGERALAEANIIRDELEETGKRYDAEIGLKDLASRPLDVVTAELNDYTAAEWIADLDVNNRRALAAVAGATEATIDWDDILAVADLDADGTLAVWELEQLIARIENYKISDNTTMLDADGAFAENELNRLQGLAAGYVQQDNTTKLRADGTDAANEIARIEQSASNLERSRRITVSTYDLASDTLLKIRRYYDNLPTTKTITVRTSTGGTIFANGGFAFADGGIARFAAGGMFPRGAIKETPGRAQIYPPASVGRFFAEPETQGEAYIPLARSKRARSARILSETARMMGMQVVPMADGGILSFAQGGITTGVAQTVEGDLPTVVVQVNVDTAPLANMDVDLEPANESIRRTVKLLDDATDSAGRFSDAGGLVGQELERAPSELSAAGGFNRAAVMTRAATVTIEAPIDLQVVAAPGMDEATVARLAGEAVREAFDDVAADLDNAFA